MERTNVNRFRWLSSICYESKVYGDIRNRNVSWKPSLEKISDNSAKFGNVNTNKLVELTPKNQLRLEDLGADLVVAFDECTSNTISKEETEKSMNRSHMWKNVH